MCNSVCSMLWYWFHCCYFLWDRVTKCRCRLSSYIWCQEWDGDWDKERKADGRAYRNITHHIAGARAVTGTVSPWASQPVQSEIGTAGRGAARTAGGALTTVFWRAGATGSGSEANCGGVDRQAGQNGGEFELWLEAKLCSFIQEPLPQVVKAESPEKSCLRTAGMEPSCHSLLVAGFLVEPWCHQVSPADSSTGDWVKAPKLGTEVTLNLNSTARCSALGATMADPCGKPTTPSSHQWLEGGWEGYLSSCKSERSCFDCIDCIEYLPPESLYSYDAPVSALEICFGSAHQAELHRVCFKAKLRKRDEDLPKLAEDIEWLALLAYPQVTWSMLDLLAKDQFILLSTKTWG